MTRPNVLIVDDDRCQLFILSNRFQKMGLEPITVENASDGLSILQSEKEIALIVSDIVMEGMSGTEFVELIRKDEKHRQIPVILTSGILRESNIARYLTLPLVRFLAKPVDKYALEEKLIELFKRTAFRNESIGVWLTSREIPFEIPSSTFDLSVV